MNKADNDSIWQRIRDEAEQSATTEPLLASFLQNTILKHTDLDSALANHLANKLATTQAPKALILEASQQAIEADRSITQAALNDLNAIQQRDSACCALSIAFLYFKGFHALQGYRIAHWLWQQQRESLALLFQSLISSRFGVDIHPAARLGSGIMMDHATGIVIGETAVVGNNVSLMQAFTGA